MNELILQNITYDKKNRATRSRRPSSAFIPHLIHILTNFTVLKRIVNFGDKGKRF